MTDERDPKVSQRYRELGSEEPPTALDAEILAASRRAAETRLAPLVPPTGRRRWYFPVAAAAIITLVVAVTVHMERQQPDAESISPPPPSTPESRTDALEAKKDSAPQAELRKAKPAKPPAPLVLPGGRRRHHHACRRRNGAHGAAATRCGVDYTSAAVNAGIAHGRAGSEKRQRSAGRVAKS